MVAVRRKRWLSVAVACLAAVAVVQGQENGGGGSNGGSAGVTTAPTTLPPPTSSKPPAPTTLAPTLAPAPTTLAPTPAPKQTTAAPTTTPAPTETTVAPTVTPAPSAAKKNVTQAPADAGPVTAETAAPEASVVDKSADASSTLLSPASTPRNGVSYGGKTSDNSSSQANDATTKSASDTTKTAVQFVAVAAGILGVVAAVALSVHFHQKRRAQDSRLDDDDKYLNPAPKRPTTVDVHAPMTTTSSAAEPSNAVLYDNFSTPTAPNWRQTNNQTKIATSKSVAPPVEKPLAISAFRDSDDPLASSQVSQAGTEDPLARSGIVTTAATTGLAATFVGRKAGENDVTGGEDAQRATQVDGYAEEDFREPRVTVKHITRCRGQSEASTTGGSDDLSQYGAGLLRSTFITDDDDGYTNTQMFAFSDSGSEGDRDSGRSQQSRGAGGAPSDVSEFLKFYDGPIVSTTNLAKHVDVDVDSEFDDDEDITGRASELTEDLRASDFTVGYTSRMSATSSIADFHDSTIDRPSDLDIEEFEV